MHWVFSPWSGNYGNKNIENPKNPEVRIRLLKEFFSTYHNMMNTNALIFIELTDAVADYRDPFDHPYGEESTNIYPVRFTPQQVEECGKEYGLEVTEKRLCVSYGHQPRVTYILKKLG